MSIVIENEKNFPHYVELLPELQRMVIDEMQPDDRCRFTRCSKSSQKDAIKSRKFIYAIELFEHSDERITLCVVFNSFDYTEKCYKRERRAVGLGYFSRFQKDSKGIFMRSRKISDPKQVRKIEYLSIEDPDVLGMQNLKILLNRYQNSVQRLVIHLLSAEEKFVNFDFELRSLPNLKELIVYNNINIVQFVSKTKRDLKVVISCDKSEENMIQVANSQQIYRVSQKIVIPSLKLNNEQWLLISASKIHINIGELTAENIYSFVKLWQNGKVGRNLRRCVWWLRDSNLDTIQLFRMLGVDYTHNNDPLLTRYKVTIKHNNDASRSAELECPLSWGALTFVINIRDSED